VGTVSASRCLFLRGAPAPGTQEPDEWQACWARTRRTAGLLPWMPQWAARHAPPTLQTDVSPFSARPLAGTVSWQHVCAYSR
jgi:hypothetical protein